jgi:hypothetical protein
MPSGIRTHLMPSVNRMEEQAMAAFQPNLPAKTVDLQLKQALDELRRAEKNAVLWFAEIQNRKLYEKLGYSSIYQYATVELAFSKGKASQFINLAESMRALPKLKRSLSRGEIPWTKAREVSRVATPKTEKAWIAEAKSSTSRELERKVAITKQRAKALRNGASTQGELAAAAPVMADGTASVGKAAAGRGKVTAEVGNVVPDRAGIPLEAIAPAEVPVDLHLRFTPDQYARYEALMEKLRKKGARESREELLLAGLEELALSEDSAREFPRGNTRKGKGVPIAHANETNGRNGGGSQRRKVDAAKFDRPEEFPRGNTKSPYQVNVQLCERCGTGTVETTKGTKALSPATLRSILCDAKIREPGRRNRTILPERLRRQAMERDRFRCRAAGCSGTRFLSVHHLVPREKGGSHELENLITLCGGCHRAAHRN